MAEKVRQPIDQDCLEQYLATSVPDIRPPLDIKQFVSGQSNPTYHLISVPTGVQYVLRKKPPGELMSRTAHKVEREYRIMNALWGRLDPPGSFCVPVPKMHCLCEDATVLGTPFFIMEFLDGRNFCDFSLPGVDAAEREEMWHDVIKTLAHLHAVEPSKVGLGDFGKKNGFYKRQIDTWARACETQAEIVDVETNEPVGPLPHMQDLLEFFTDKSRQPEDRATLVHGDFKIDNIVFHKTEPRVIGIIDWEMSTIGHPLSDLANLMTNFYIARMQNPSPHPEFLPGATPGLPRPEQLLRWYVEASAQAVAAMPDDGGGKKGIAQPVIDPRSADFEWAMAFSVFRLAAICHGIAARYARRQASSGRAREAATERFELAESAWILTREGTVKSSRL